MKARTAEAFLHFLPTFSIQLANSQFRAKYGILPTGPATRSYPGWAAFYPLLVPPCELAQGLTSKDNTFLYMFPTHPHCLDQATCSRINVKNCSPQGYREGVTSEATDTDKSFLEVGRWV